MLIKQIKIFLFMILTIIISTDDNETKYISDIMFIQLGFISTIYAL